MLFSNSNFNIFHRSQGIQGKSAARLSKIKELKSEKNKQKKCKENFNF